jgi:hypothetical protein
MHFIYYGAAEAIVLYNDYLFFGNDYNWMENMNVYVCDRDREQEEEE